MKKTRAPLTEFKVSVSQGADLVGGLVSGGGYLEVREKLFLG